MYDKTHYNKKKKKNPPEIREIWVWSLVWEDPLEKGKATHSIILAWRIPWNIQLHEILHEIYMITCIFNIHDYMKYTDVDAETPVLCPPDVKSWLIWKDPDAGKVWRQEGKEMTEDEMVGWHHQLNGHEFG